MTYDELKALIEKRGVHAVFGPPGEGFAIEQNPHELALFLAHMQALGVQSVLEIGTGYKAGLSRFLAQDLGWRVVSVDTYHYHHVFEGVTYIVTPSPEIAVTTDHFDLVIIDADHRYENVKRDVKLYAPLADKVIMLHDIAGLRDCEGVAQFWREIAYTPRLSLQDGYYEIIEDSDQCGGIGWVAKVYYPNVLLTSSGIHTPARVEEPPTAPVKKRATRKAKK